MTGKNSYGLILCSCSALLLSCGGGVASVGSSGSLNVARAACEPATYDSSLPFSPRESHVFIVIEENHSFDSVLNNSNMPFLNGLAKKYAYAQGYFANAHPSLPNYFMATAGDQIAANDELTATVNNDNIVRELIPAGKTWKSYAEDLPSVGYTGPTLDLYIEHHNPISYFSDVRNDPTQVVNLVPFTQIFTDLNAHALPDYGFIVPDVTHDAHSCLLSMPNCTDDQKLVVADQWLRDNLGPLVYSPDFNKPGGGVLIITFDESTTEDTQMRGGHVFWVAIGADVKKGYVSSICYQHESTLRFTTHMLGLPTAPGKAATAADMREFLEGN